MKLNTMTLVALIAALTVIGCVSPSRARWEKADIATKNEFLVIQYALDCQQRNAPFPLGHLGWNEIDTYWEKHEELRTLRDKFEQADAELHAVLMTDKQYREMNDWYSSTPKSKRAAILAEYNRVKGQVFDRMEISSQEYRQARVARDKALYASNMRTLHYVVIDAKKTGKLLPVDWMPKETIEKYIDRF